jgi:hypothetical protein
MNNDIHAASHALRDASHYLAMAWMKELEDKPLGWPMKLAVERLTEAAHALGYVLVPARAEAPADASATEEAA